MQSAKIADKIYECRWYDLKTKKREIRSLMTVSAVRAKKPVQLSALGFSNISFETFVSVSKILIKMCSKNFKGLFFQVVKFSYSVLILLIQKRKRK